MNTPNLSPAQTAKHTPGPWHGHSKLSSSENHTGFRVYGPGASGWTIAEVMPIDPDGLEGAANARLIASAPDLLEALQTLLDALPFLSHSAIENARAAIAKAQGEQA